MPSSDDTLIYFGDAVKVLDETAGEVKVGGLLVHFDEPGAGRADLAGEYFTADTYFGAQMALRGEAVLDSMYNHGIATNSQLKALAEHEFLPLEARKTDTGIMAEIILRERDDYEAMVADLVREGKIGWSSGSAPHAVQKSAGGEITRWPLVEGSLTHRPAEPRTSAVTLKALATGEASGPEDRAEGRPLSGLLQSVRSARQRLLITSLRQAKAHL